MGERAFCPTCRRFREVMDTYETDVNEGPVYVARPLECGHDAGDGGGLPYRPARMSVLGMVEQINRLEDLQQDQDS